jgi:UDP-N-acetyl-D-mannosaminuronic acid transferase (WecB/TagA/CpsF family)
MQSKICLWLKSVVRRFGKVGTTIVFVGLGWMSGETFERWVSHQINNETLAVMMAAIIEAFIIYVRVLPWPNS